MVIAIGANGDGVLHWCHYVQDHWSQLIAIGTIFCRHWRQWREPQIVMTLLPNITSVSKDIRAFMSTFKFSIEGSRNCYLMT